MKKSLLVMFVVILAIALAFVWVWAKDSVNPTAKQTTVSQPTLQVQKKNVSGPANRKGLVVDKFEAVEKPALPTREKPLDYCEVPNADVYEQVVGTYSFTAPPGWVSWVYGLPEVMVTLLDPAEPYYGPCTQPTFPFNVTDVSMLFRRYGTAGVPTSAWMHGVIYEAVPDPIDPTCLVPGAELARTADYYDVGVPASRVYIFAQPLLTPVCVYGKFFAGWVWDSMPGITDTLAGYVPRFEIRAPLCTDYDDYGAGWYDWAGYAGAGPLAMWASGYVRSQNTCAPDTVWFFKKAYAEAPCGLPDFDQAVLPGPAYCGPTAKANCLWWMWASGAIPRFWAPGAPPGTFDWPILANMIAGLAQTDPVTGTECDKLFEADMTLRTQIPLWVTERNVYAPGFDFLEVELRKSEDIILLLGFWYDANPNPDPDSVDWKRFGGHFVTVNGVNQALRAFSISDPAFDNAEAGQLGSVACHIDPWPHVGNPAVHNNPANVSRDFFPVTPGSPSPGGTEGLPTYWYGRETEMARFAGQNFRTVHLPNQGDVPPPGTLVFTEIEQAIIISPSSNYETGQVDGSHGVEVNNNHGGIEAHAVDFGAGLQAGLYYGTFALGNNDTNMAADYGDYLTNGLNFTPLAHPDLKSFNITGAAGPYTVNQLTNHFTHWFFTGLGVDYYSFGLWVPVGGTEDCEYVIEDIWFVKNNGVDPILGLDAAMFMDYDIGAADSVDFDQQHQSVWIYAKATPGVVFGITKKPAVIGDIPITGYGFNQEYRVYPTGPTGGGIYDSLYSWMHLGWGVDAPYTDMSIILGGKDFDLAPGAVHMEKYLKWGYGAAIAQGGDAAWRKFLYNVLHQEGFYRGDVNKDGKLSAADVMYYVNFMYKSGPKPMEFVDQGDINNTGNVNAADLIYLINYLYKSGPAPIDKNRFLADPNNFVDPAYRDLGLRNPGLFGDPDWRDLGK